MGVVPEPELRWASSRSSAIPGLLPPGGARVQPLLPASWEAVGLGFAEPDLWWVFSHVGQPGASAMALTLSGLEPIFRGLLNPKVTVFFETTVDI